MPAQILPPEAFPFCGPSYLLPSPVLDAQRSINLYPEPGIQGSKTQMGLTGRPGTVNVGVTALGAGFGHSLYAGSGRLFAATGTHVYEVSSAGAIITDYGTGISNSGPGPTPMIANGIQLLICDPVAGKIFNVNPSGPSLDQVFSGLALEYLDDFYVSIATGASLVGANPNQVNVSKNADGTTWPALSYFIETSAADQITQLATLNSLLYIFGQKTIRIWYNAGNNVQPFARISGGVLNIGCLAPNSVVKFSNTLLWLGSDATGYGQVYMMQGTNPVRVSNASIEWMIQYMGASTFGLLTSAQAYGYQEAGHTFYVLVIPQASLHTWRAPLFLVYDLTTGLWHERQYAGGAGSIWPCCFANVPGLSSTAAPLFVLDAQGGQLWYQGIGFANDGQVGASPGNSITYQRTAPHIGSQNRVFKYPRFELDMDPQANGAAGSIQPVLDYSNNGGRSFLGYNYPMQQAYDAGFNGGFQRFYHRELGRSRDRVFKVTITDNANLIRIANAYLTVEAEPD